MTRGFPVFWERAAGSNVVDVDGNVFLDLTGAFGVALPGHTSPAVVSGVTDQMSRLIHGMGDVHPPSVKVEFLEALTDIAPWPGARVILGSSGSEAVEAALKTALLATGRPGILAFEGAYHGLTLGSLAATHREDFRGPFRSRVYPGVAFAPFPGKESEGPRAAPHCLDTVARILQEGAPGGDAVGCVIIEPIQGRGGVRIPPPGFLRDLAELTRSAGAVLVFDEIFTGLGRTGQLFACVAEGVLPDLICLGKGLGGGLPLSACLGPPEVMDAWPASSGEAIHTSTFLGHPLACVAGLAVLRELESGGLVERSRRLGGRFSVALAEATGGSRWVKEVRGRGLFLGVELVDPETDGPLVGGGVRVAERALQQGMLLLPAGAAGEVVEITPPLVLTEEQMEWAIPAVAGLCREPIL
jgi:4-aminobutyrate aminotransferase-like enzyme